MNLITKDHRSIECKFIDFTPNEVLPDDNNVEVILWNDTSEYEKMSNIAYIWNDTSEYEKMSNIAYIKP